MIESKKNKALIQQLLSCFDAGEKAADCFPAFCPVSWRSYLEGFLASTDFAQAFFLTRHLQETRDELQKKCHQQLFYPCLLLVLSLLGTILFSRFVFPAMIRMAEGFDTDTAGLKILQNLLQVFSIGLIALILAGSLLLLYALAPSRMVSTYQLLEKILPGNLWTAYTSIDFGRFLLETIRTGMPTARSLTMLEHLSTSPLVAALANTVHQALNQGCRFNDAIAQKGLDPLLPRFLKLAIYASSPIVMLEQYQTMALARYEARIHRLTRIIQAIAYAGIGILIVIIYRILLMPISILGSL